MMIWLCWTVLASAQESPVLKRASPYSPVTIVVCNQNVPGSIELGAYYARAREIRDEQIVVLDCPDTEEISRQEFEEMVEQPLRAIMLRRGWWEPRRDPNTGEQVVRSRVQVAVMMYGMPLKIRDEQPAGKPADPNTLTITAASVDSELAVLGQPGLTREGPLKNPYFQSVVPFAAAKLPILLVGRIDGPSPEVCTRMIDDAITAEMKGLWGNAYIDLDDYHEMANSWLIRSAESLRKFGVTVTTSFFGETFPANYPFHDPIVYFGWWEEKVNAAFTNPGFKFRPGAIACHLHSLSANKIRTTDEHWAGPLLNKGAAAVLGNVYEPYLQFTHQFDVFTDRLTHGFTFIESAYASVETLSWMNVAIGDPLYQPFPPMSGSLDEKQFSQDQDAPYKVLRLAYARWGEGRELPVKDLFFKIELASAKLPRAEFMEHQALAAVEKQDYTEAQIQFRRARLAYKNPADQLRMELGVAEMDRRRGDRLAAFKALREAVKEFAAIPEVEAAEGMLAAIQNQPAPPEPPKPAPVTPPPAPVTPPPAPAPPKPATPDS